jgi:hypothetical protein
MPSLRLFLGAVVLVGLLAGCTAPDPAPTMDPAQARADLYVQLDKVQALVGGDWFNSDDPTPVECSLGGVDGVTFAGFRLTNDSAGDASLDTVAALWEDAGYVITTQNNVGPYKRVIATSPTDPGNVLVFGVAENAMSLDAQGECGEGDLLEWIHKIRQEFEDADSGT